MGEMIVFLDGGMVRIRAEIKGVAVKKKVGYVEIKKRKKVVVIEEKEPLMKSDIMKECHSRVIDRLRRLPRKMLLLHGLDNVTEFVLHELASKDCFDLKKAAYFIDNPDFNCFKGVAGISNTEISGIEDIWVSPDAFTKSMTASPFNQHVRSFTYKSHKKNDELYEKVANDLANELGLECYDFYVWDMKHDNHGFLVCEKNDVSLQEKLHDDIVIDGLSLLSFCPVH